MPSVPYNSRDPKVYALYKAWWADCKARVEALGYTFVLFGDFTDRSLAYRRRGGRGPRPTTVSCAASTADLFSLAWDRFPPSRD